MVSYPPTHLDDLDGDRDKLINAIQDLAKEYPPIPTPPVDIKQISDIEECLILSFSAMRMDQNTPGTYKSMMVLQEFLGAEKVVDAWIKSEAEVELLTKNPDAHNERMKKLSNDAGMLMLCLMSIAVANE